VTKSFKTHISCVLLNGGSERMGGNGDGHIPKKIIAEIGFLKPENMI
jgi:hypothetical protein